MAIFFVISAMSIPLFKLVHLANRLKWVFLIFPHYALSSSLNNLHFGTMLENVCEAKCDLLPICDRNLLCKLAPECCEEVEYFEWAEPGIGRNLTYMTSVGVVCFAILLIIEYRLLASLVYAVMNLFKRQLPPESEDGFMDDDVLAEKQRVSTMPDEDIGFNNLVIRKASKFYGKFLAVNQISIAIKPAECFGLLGVNGE